MTEKTLLFMAVFKRDLVVHSHTLVLPALAQSKSPFMSNSAYSLCLAYCTAPIHHVTFPLKGVF